MSPTSASPFFSVIINVYNGEAFLRETIESVLAQSFSDWELILWDDGSKDGGPEICASYSDPRIRFIRSPKNQGLGHARNAAFEQARGQWVAWVDQDDIWMPTKLADQHALIAADKTGRLGLVYGRTVRFDDEGNESPFDPWYSPGELPEGDVFADLLRRATFIALSSAAFRHDALKSIGGIPTNLKYCSDYYVCLSVAKNYLVACVQTVCVRYRVHPSSMSHLFKTGVHEEAIYILRTLGGAEYRKVLAPRVRIHQSWISVEELRRGRYRDGIIRLLTKGAPLYLALRPFVTALRSLRQRERLGR